MTTIKAIDVGQLAIDHARALADRLDASAEKEEGIAAELRASANLHGCAGATFRSAAREVRDAFGVKAAGK